MVVVAHHRLDDQLALAKATNEIRADDVVRPFDLVRQDFADVVRNAARRTTLTSAPTSEASIDAMCAASTACCN